MKSSIKSSSAKRKFAEEIEEYVTKNSCNYIDAIVDYCKQ